MAFSHSSPMIESSISFRYIKCRYTEMQAKKYRVDKNTACSARQSPLQTLGREGTVTD